MSSTTLIVMFVIIWNSDFRLQVNQQGHRSDLLDVVDRGVLDEVHPYEVLQALDRRVQVPQVVLRYKTNTKKSWSDP